MPDLIPVDNGPQAMETPEGGAVLVDSEGNVLEHLAPNCPMCGRIVTSYFDHVDVDCLEWPDNLQPVARVIQPGARMIAHHEVDDDKVIEYRRAMLRGDQFPPIRVVDCGESGFMIVDGHHRSIAARQAGLPIRALVVAEEAFESMDAALRPDGYRADDEQFWG